MRMVARGSAARGMVALLVAMAVATASPAAAEGGIEAWDGERAFLELERLEAEIGMLRALAAVQEALLAWNRARAGSGGVPAVLPQALCAEEGLAPWCRALPATFGAGAGRGAANPREDGER